MNKRIGIFVLSALACAGLSYSILTSGQDSKPAAPAQSAPADQSAPIPVIHATSRLVLLDVIVTDHSGKFVPGLKASDFTVLEDNKPQKISAFGVQIPPPAPKSYPPLNLPPHQYSNFTYVKPVADRPVTVVLMDMLNTTGMDQSYARKQMIKFLEKLPPGQPIALFALTSKLRMIQGFSGDSDTLVKAAKALQGHESLLLSPESQLQNDENLATAIENTASPSSKGPNASLSTMPMAPVGQALRDAVSAQDSFQKLERMNMTLNALDTLAHAVAGYPGRKNLIWLSAEFPVVFGPGLTPYNPVINMQTGTTHTNDQLRDLENDTPPLQQTAALLAAVRLAIYPIDVRGQVSVGTGIDISTQTAYLGTVDMQNEAATTSLRQTTVLWDTHEAMTDIARETGGRAFYGTNDLNDAMSRSVQQGSSYYTLAYAPTNHDWKGKYRKIEVKTAVPSVELTYRRGYYALKERVMKADRAKVEMAAALQPSVPESTGLVLKVQVLPPDADHKAVRIDYAVDAHDISFSDSVDQRKQGSIGFAAAAWDKDLKLAGQVVETKETNFPLDAYQQVLQSYLPFHQELELKPGTYTLRLGVLDLTSHKLGSVGVPITVPESAHH
ncbi:MAG: VWA domain-containing protein [Candidatus Sulfotelmatobacter sp.]